MSLELLALVASNLIVIGSVGYYFGYVHGMNAYKKMYEEIYRD